MSTVTYKATGRYQFGWSDPRALAPGSFVEVDVSLKDMPMDPTHFANTMTTEQLRAAWTLQYGDRAVSTEQLSDDPDMLSIAQVLFKRGQLIEQRRLETYSHCYALKPEKAHG